VARKKASPKKSATLEEEVRALLEATLPDDELQQKLEALATKPAFDGLTYLWGPILYGRNQARFRPFILAHFSTFTRIWMQVPWKRNAAGLDAWLEEADRRDDAELFSRLYLWKYTSSQLLKQWCQDLRSRFEAAGDSAQRSGMLRKLDMQGLLLDDETAAALYAIDAAVARPFILRHLPSGGWGGTRKLPQKLCDLARRHGDDDLYFTLYRLNVPAKTWEKDVEGLGRTVTDPQQLVAELERRHPGQAWGMGVGKGLFALLHARGRDVIPYVLKHVDELAQWGFSSVKDRQRILEQARKQGWWDLTSAMVRKGDNGQYNKEVLALVNDHKQPDEVVFRRLAALSGPTFEWQWGRSAVEHYQPLKEATAVALYRCFPELVRGPFRKHLGFSFWGWKGYPDLVSAARDDDDEALLGYLACQVLLAGRNPYHARNTKRAEERLLKHYQSLRSEPVVFARRLAAVLGHLPAQSLGRGYRGLLQHSALARLFFEEGCAGLLEEPRALRDLLEAAEIHVQLLALRALGQEDERARQLAADNLDLLQATLLQSMSSKSRRLAFRALANAATTLESARLIANKARQALVLPEKGYPRGQLLALLAGINRRWPALRGAQEQPVIYRSKKQRPQWAPSAPR
jgi:hypothetical protein